MKDIHEKMDDISDLIKGREVYQRLKEIESKMNEDLEVLKLANDFNLAQSEYNSCLNHYAFESEEAKKYQRRLYEAKLSLDEHPLIKEYYECLKEVNEPLRYLEFNLLNPITSPTKFKK